ncbi:uncharacterized protein LOC115957054 [Quercus lobata]|uniref:uncharacterized protein LOC115957054 n=1 Tax=Quercus lobata TaxID=97700 RepID=UPI001248E912|nr:uncharacterized protein LOC115957054 [Quercus lobata]
MLMAITFTLPYCQRNAMLPLSPTQIVRSRVDIACITSSFHQTNVFSQKPCSECSFLHVARLSLVNFKRMTWSIRSNVDSSGFDPSPANSPNGRTRLIRAFQAIRTKVIGTFYLLPWRWLLLRALEPSCTGLLFL